MNRRPQPALYPGGRATLRPAGPWGLVAPGSPWRQARRWGGAAARGRGLLGLLAGLALVGPPSARAAPPPVRDLFGCPLAEGAARREAWRPPPSWRKHQLPGGGGGVTVPPDWTRTSTQRGLRLSAPRRRLEVAAWWAREGLSARTVRAAQEGARLGPSLASPACEARVAARLSEVTGLRAPLVGSYGRPLGGRRRTVAAFFPTPRGVLVVTVTARWGRREREAPWEMIRRVLGGVWARSRGGTRARRGRDP